MPYLTYCYLIWHFCKAPDARNCWKSTETALRIVYNTHSVEYTNLLNRANLPSLQNRHLQDLATLMYKAKYGLVPSNVVDIFSIKSSKYQVRNMDFHLPRFNSVHYGKHSLWYFGPYIYFLVTWDLIFVCTVSWAASINEACGKVTAIWPGLDWTAKSRTNLPYNPLSPTYGILTL